MAENHGNETSYERASRAADVAMNAVLGGLHFNAALAPVLGRTRAAESERIAK